MIPRALLVAVLALSACAHEPAPSGGAQAAFDLSAYELADLSHGYGPETVYWPNAPTRFEKTPIFDGTLVPKVSAGDKRQ